MKRYANPRQTVIFVLIASLLMVVTDYMFSPGIKSPVKITAVPPREKIYENSEILDYKQNMEPAPLSEPVMAAIDLDIPQPAPVHNDRIATATLHAPKIIQPPLAIPKGKALVAIVIDDMGMDRKHSNEAVNLPPPVTLAFLPYAPKLDEITKAALSKGHELLIHVPMQPLDSTLDAGPLVIRTDMTQENFNAAMEHIFNSFKGYVGINNHMGSKATQDKPTMDRVMESLAARKLIFLDSKTIGNSVGAESAAEHGLRYAQRDIFIDHEDTKEFAMQSLEQLEALAKKRGYAIAIGHPKAITLKALEEWIPTLKEKGIMLVPITQIVRRASAVIQASESYGPVLQPVRQP